MEFDKMIIGKYYQIGYCFIKLKSKTDKLVESYPGKFSNVYTVDIIDPLHNTIELDKEIIKNPNFNCIEDVDVIRLQEHIAFHKKHQKILEEIYINS